MGKFLLSGRGMNPMCLLLRISFQDPEIRVGGADRHTGRSCPFHGDETKKTVPLFQFHGVKRKRPSLCFERSRPFHGGETKKTVPLFQMAEKMAIEGEMVG